MGSNALFHVHVASSFLLIGVQVLCILYTSTRGDEVTKVSIFLTSSINE